MSNPMQRDPTAAREDSSLQRRRDGGGGGEDGQATVSPGAVPSPTSTSSHQRHQHQQGNNIARSAAETTAPEQRQTKDLAIVQYGLQ